jgi:prepilin signal peptidase PulO-like enzyme (type II secretory pathway)
MCGKLRGELWYNKGVETLLYLFVFLLGLIVGSFLNVVIFRYNTGLTVGGRSKCMSCYKTLRWYELVPVLSYVAQRGKCRGCRAKFSWQYPAVEMATALLFLLIFNFQFSRLGGGQAIFNIFLGWLVASILIVITVYDLRHEIIPDGLVCAFDILALLSVVYAHSWEQFLVGVACFLFLGSFWFFSRGRWMGLGDAKLALGIGWFLPFPQGIAAVIIAFWSGALVGILLLLARRKKFTLKSEMPFAPFLVLGFLLAYFFGISIL